MAPVEPSCGHPDADHQARDVRVIYEQDPTSGDWGAHAADLPVFVGGGTREEVQTLIQGAIAFHLDGLRAEGLPLPAPRSEAGAVEVAA